MQLDAKTTWWLTFILVAVQGLNTIAWTSLGLDAKWVAAIGQADGYLTLLLTFAIHGSVPGIPPVQMPKAIVFLALALGALIVTPSAHAQQRRPTEATPQVAPPKPLICDPLNLLPGCNIEVPSADGKSGSTNQPVEMNIWMKIATAALPDLDYASQLAAAAGTPGSGVRKQCWDAIILANKQAAGLGVKDASGNLIPRPDPHLFSDVESLSEVLDNLAPKGPLWTACAGAAQLQGTTVLTFINAAVTGAAGLSLLGVT